MPINPLQLIMENKRGYLAPERYAEIEAMPPDQQLTAILQCWGADALTLGIIPYALLPLFYVRFKLKRVIQPSTFWQVERMDYTWMCEAIHQHYNKKMVKGFGKQEKASE